MGVEMPRMDGFEATKQIMMTVPTPIVLVSNSAVVHEVDTAMRALHAGAITIQLKPLGPDSPGFEKSASELIATVKAMADVVVVRHHSRHVQRPQPSPLPPPATGRIVAIATSTGGPPALQTVLSGLPADFPVPILIVQHIADSFTAGLASWLDGAVAVTVKVAEDGEPLRPGTAYIAPENHHLGVSHQRTVALSGDSPIDGFRPSGTFLFQSVAGVYGASAIAVMMTGMGEDGVEGLRAFRDTGGLVVGQDEASCVVYGMPGAAAATGLVHIVRPLGLIAGTLNELVKSPRHQWPRPFE